MGVRWGGGGIGGGAGEGKGQSREVGREELKDKLFCGMAYVLFAFFLLETLMCE